MSWTFRNPVELHWSEQPFEDLGRLVGDARVLLVTGRGAGARGWLQAAEQALGPRLVGVCDQITPNPDLLQVQQLGEQWQTCPAELVVGLGGGSVLDTTKALAAVLGGTDPSELAAALRSGRSAPEGLQARPWLAIPTTAGTGSEVTMWATLWDRQDNRKLSLSHPDLYARQAILSPALTADLSLELTAQGALDALSHALESLWTRNHNPLSDTLAQSAATTIADHLVPLLQGRALPQARSHLLQASLQAGLAISNTRTALAHSLSYPLTLERDVPHGFACSFALPQVLRLAVESDPERSATYVAALGCLDLEEACERLERILERARVGPLLRRLIPDAADLQALRGPFLTGGRGDQMARPVSESEARNLVLEAYQAVAGTC